MLRSTKGSTTLVIAILAGAAGVGFFLWMGFSQKSTRVQVLAKRSELAARLYAAELLEYFATHSTAELTTRLAQNPKYHLCTPVNRLDRATSTVNQPHSLADLSSDQVSESISSNGSVNRSFVVRVVDTQTLVPKASECGKFADVAVLGPTDKYLVTVSMTWLSEVEREVKLSTLIP